MTEKLVNGMIVTPVGANLDISLPFFQPFEQVGASRAEMQWLANSSLIHLRDDFAAVAFSEPFFTSQLGESFPFIGQSPRQFGVGGFGGAFEPLNLSVTPDAVKTGNPVGAFRRIMCVFGD